MIHALLLTLALQGGPIHADLHPADADLYIELGDLSTLWPVLEKAPFLTFLRDARMKGVVAKLGLPTDTTLKALAMQAFTDAMPEAKAADWLDGLKTISFSVSSTGSKSAEEARERLEAVADLATPAQAAALKAAILTRAPKHEPLSASLPEVERLLMSDDHKDDLWCVSIGSRVVLGGGATKVEEYAARADKKSPGFGSNEKWKQGLAALEKPNGTPLLWFGLSRSISEILAATQEADDEGAKFLEQLPADFNPLGGPRVARMQFTGSRFVTELFAAGADAGAKAVEDSWLEPVPDSAMLAYSTAFDGVAAAKTLRAILSKGEQGAATLAALEQKIGFGPERVLAHLGPAFTLYLGAIAGIGPPETRIWVDCDDPAAFQKDLETLVGALGETMPGLEVKTKPYKVKNAKTGEKVEPPVTTLNLPPSMQIPMVAIAPSFSVVGKRLVFGLNSMDVKNELKRLYAGDADAIVPGANPLAARGFALPEGARSIVVMDWSKFFSGLVTLYGGLAPMMGMQVDKSILPPPALFSELFKPTFHYSKVVAGGSYRRNEASFGPETWFGLVALGMRASKSFQLPGAQGLPVDGAPPLQPPGKGQ